MRAGKLDRDIRIERSTDQLDAFGVPTEAWTKVIDLRAEIVEASIEEAQRAYGTATEFLTTFRTRFYYGITLADRIVYDGRAYNIVHIKEIGRRRGLEFRTISRGA